ncbi:nitroreductase/quinone reductase family protein [Herbiconiux sp. L3-i23]|uniref:nitroreductase/quinone reductase family protein n=1 Tax=Herbiconiux sp. L3-i23 TaxID=2905871 RepID=UPI00204E2EC3|nr:nitroreductase/quinone reductase family protein [Herbiconiux sp. L3-i23]BDI22060.1 nitroreductase [Herbiconiux sp. L3-i23]
MPSGSEKYIRPGRPTRIANALLTALGRRGVSLAGSRTLTIVGRVSGEPRSTPVNPLTLGTETYLVAARGTTEWVRNLRVAGEGTLTLGREVTLFTAVEVVGEERVPILRVYLAKWAWEVGTFFELPKNPSTAAIRAVAPLHPVFRLRLGEPTRK